MANIKSAQKRIRTSERNRARNRVAKVALRTQVKKFRAAVAAGDAAAVAALLPVVHGLLDRSAGRNLVHPRTASRTKSRLARAASPLLARSSG